MTDRTQRATHKPWTHLTICASQFPMAPPGGRRKRKPARKLPAVDENKKDAKETRSGGYKCNRCHKLTKGHVCPFVSCRYLIQRPLKTKVQNKPHDGTDGIYYCRWCGQLTKGHICTYHRDFRCADHAEVDSEELMNAPLPEVCWSLSLRSDVSCNAAFFSRC